MKKTVLAAGLWNPTRMLYRKRRNCSANYTPERFDLHGIHHVYLPFLSCFTPVELHHCHIQNADITTV